MSDLVTHAVLISDPSTGDVYPAQQTGYSLTDVIIRVHGATRPGSGNVFEGMIPIVDPFPLASH